MSAGVVVDTLYDFSRVSNLVDGSDRNHDQVCLLIDTANRHYPRWPCFPALNSISSTSTTMALFRRKKQRNDDADGQNGERKKEKGSWRRPASESLNKLRATGLTAALQQILLSSSSVSRHGSLYSLPKQSCLLSSSSVSYSPQ